LLRAFGFLDLFEDARKFTDSWKALGIAESLAAQYGNTGETYEELVNNKMKENFITIDNIKSILYLIAAVILISGFCLIVEIISSQVVITIKD